MKFIAHRGYAQQFCRKNTLQAFEAVIRHPQNGRSVIGIELDIHLTGDGRIAVIHDTALKDSHGRAVAVAAVSFAQVQQLFKKNCGDRSLSVPDIDETLALVAHRTELCLEIKQAAYDMDRFTGRLLESLQSYRPRGDVVLSSFSEDILRFVMHRANACDLKYAFVFKDWKSWQRLSEDVHARLDFAHPHYALLLEDETRILELGLGVQCWTVNEPSQIESLLDLPDFDRIRAVMTDNLSLSDRYGMG